MEKDVAKNDYEGFEPTIDPFRFSYADPILYAGFGLAPVAPATPFNGQPKGLIDQDITQVDPQAGVAPLGQVIPVQNIDSDLVALRREMPWLPILKRPLVSTLFFAAANVRQDFAIPPGVGLIRFKGNGGYWVGFDAGATVPSAAQADTFSAYRPEEEWYYARNLKQVSVVADAINVSVSIRMISLTSF